jgi:hypothetical protein
MPREHRFHDVGSAASHLWHGCAMWSWEVVAGLVLGLLGLGVMVGQNFTLSWWVALFWIPAGLLLLVRSLHREPRLPLLLDEEKPVASSSSRSQPRVTREAYRVTEAVWAARIMPPQTLLEMCGEIARGKTTHERQETAKRFHGLWAHVLGNVTDTLPDDGSDVVKVPLFVPIGGLQVTLALDLELRSFVLTLKPGTDGVEAMGKIVDIGANWALLAPVKILQYGPPNKMIKP